jgi:Helitron helicase-like domain at N-terminus
MAPSKSHCVSYTQRKKASVENPVAVAFKFRAMMENILTILFGCPVEFQPGTNSKKVTTWFFKATASNCPHDKGIFGQVRSFFGCIETQARGALHFHVLLWCGLEPKLLHNAAYIPQLCVEVEKALDAIYQAEIPLNMHVKDIAIHKMKETPNGLKMLPRTSKTYPAMRRAPSILNSKQQWRQFFWENVLKTGIHEHTFTCKKPPQGFHHRRTGQPSGNSKKKHSLCSLKLKVASTAIIFKTRC